MGACGQGHVDGSGWEHVDGNVISPLFSVEIGMHMSMGMKHGDGSVGMETFQHGDMNVIFQLFGICTGAWEHGDGSMVMGVWGQESDLFSTFSGGRGT